MPRRKALPDKLDLSLLHMFRVIVEEKSISRAAIRLNLTQSAVSHGLKRLEEQMGVLLIERGNRPFNLTEQGVLLQETANRVYGEVLRLDNALSRNEQSLAGTLYLLVVSRIVSETFDEFLAAFRQRYPRIKITVEMLPSSEILKRINQNVGALGLCLCRHEMKNIRRVLLIPERYSLYCGKHHRLFKQKNIKMQDLLSQDFVAFFSEQWGDALSPLAVFRDEKQFTGEVVAFTNNLDEMKRLLYAGYGIGCLADNAVAEDVRAGRLRQLPSGAGIADIPIYLAWNTLRKLKPVEEVFIEGLYEAFAVDAAPHHAPDGQD
ncbi:Transcriptional regulator, LysR family [uncultured delta proteobacterium]|uniref:Transcriptional regulator, LysR family n=1 Tax=uncultured delta proteobacterium TaxID=34034 RepID=A0A212JFJ0_9DELT|nr:Transcriptional regulator, LysR family [uncultured delta proteobacterium]